MEDLKGKIFIIQVIIALTLSVLILLTDVSELRTLFGIIAAINIYVHLKVKYFTNLITIVRVKNKPK